MKTFFFFVLLSCGWLPPLSLQAQTIHPALRSGEIRLRRVLILPPGLAVVQQGITQTDYLEQPTADLTARLSAALSAAFAAQGLAVVPNPFSPAALQQDSQLQYELADLQARYDLQAPSLHQEKQTWLRGEFTFGKDVAALNRAVGGEPADAFVLVRGYGADPTLAKTAFALLVPFGGTPLTTLYLSLALLDARTGDVLWLTRQTLNGNFRQPAKADKLLAQALTKALKTLPVPPKQMSK